MNRRSFVKSSGIALSAIALFGHRSIAQLLADPAYKITMLTEDIGIFTERGGTIMFMITNKGMVVVDSQFPESATNLISELKKKSEKPFKLLINTHHHGDHTSGNILFKGLTERVVAHENSKANQLKVATAANSEAKQLFPDKTYTKTWSSKVGGKKIKLHYFGAGHTNGDSLVHFQDENILHMGDLFFNRRHPFIDKTAGADIKNWMTVLQKATDKFGANAKYVCGHAEEGYNVVAKSSDVLAFRDYLGNLLNFTEAAIKSGKTKPEILAATTIPGSPEWKGSGIERPLAAAYNELTANLK